MTPRYNKTSRVLVAFVFGEGVALAVERGEPLDELRFLCDASKDGFSLRRGRVQHFPVQDGFYMGVLSLVDNGSGDPPEVRRVSVTLTDLRPLQAPEWVQHLNGMPPWDALNQER